MSSDLDVYFISSIVKSFPITRQMVRVMMPWTQGGRTSSCFRSTDGNETTHQMCSGDNASRLHSCARIDCWTCNWLVTFFCIIYAWGLRLHIDQLCSSVDFFIVSPLGNVRVYSTEDDQIMLGTSTNFLVEVLDEKRWIPHAQTIKHLSSLLIFFGMRSESDATWIDLHQEGRYSHEP